MNKSKSVRSIIKKAVSIIIVTAFTMIMFFESTSIVSRAEDPYEILLSATTVYNGVDYSAEYDAYCYYMNYADIRAAFGMDPYALIMHYALYGRFEGSIANRLIATEEVVVPSGDDSVSVIDINKHDNGGMSAKQEQIARSKASQIATEIKKAAANYTPKKGTGVEVLECAYAAGIVQAYCNDGTYTTSGKNYRTAYGVFVAREYSSEGATRALGLILDYLGIRWEHANIGTYADQWCRVIVDGQEGFADGINGVAGYGKSSLEGGDGKEISYADVRAMFSVY
jgi:hypothetical protein